MSQNLHSQVIWQVNFGLAVFPYLGSSILDTAVTIKTGITRQISQCYKCIEIILTSWKQFGSKIRY